VHSSASDKKNNFALSFISSTQMLNRNKHTETNQEEPQPNETTPLNNEPSMPTSNPGTSSNVIMDNDTKRVLIKIAIDLVLAGCGECSSSGCC
jgi:hypothetical protein